MNLSKILYLHKTNKIQFLFSFEALDLFQKPAKTSWTSAVEALKDALDLEVKVTNKIRDIIITCENPTEAVNDYHVSTYTDTLLFSDRPVL